MAVASTGVDLRHFFPGWLLQKKPALQRRNGLKLFSIGKIAEATINGISMR
jgi:hypothetical protein